MISGLDEWSAVQSKTIDFLRFPLTAVVVLLHCALSLKNGSSGYYYYICFIISNGLCRVAVPCFFFFSGFLFFNRLHQWKWNIYLTKLITRVKTLVIPYLFWNLIAFFALWAYRSLQNGSTSFTEFFQECGGLSMFYGQGGAFPVSVRSLPIDSPLWFIRDLFYLVILAPIIFALIKYTKWTLPLLLCIAYILNQGTIREGLAFFTLGSFFQIKRINYLSILHRFRVLLYISTLCFFVIYCLTLDLGINTLIRGGFIFLGISSLLCVTANGFLHSRIRIHPFLVKSSFYVLSLHLILILDHIAVPLSRCPIPVPGFVACIWDLVFSFLITVGICLSLFFLSNRLLPKTTALLTGSRNVHA